MFAGAKKFNQNLTGWVVTSVDPQPPTDFTYLTPTQWPDTPNWI